MLALVLAPMLLSALFVAAGPAALRVRAAQFSTGAAHLDVTIRDTGATQSIDLPMYPPRSGPDPGPLHMPDGTGRFGSVDGRGSRVSLPPQTEWDSDHPGFMQFLFADLTSDPAPLLWIYGPAQRGKQETRMGQLDLQIAIRMPGQPNYAENRSVNAGGGCTLEIDGSPTTTLTGSFECINMGSVGGFAVTSPPVINVTGTFTVVAEGGGGGASPDAPGGSSDDIPVEIAVAGGGGVVVVTTVTIGFWRWRRRRGPMTPREDQLGPRVPARCREIADRYDRELEILHSLREAGRALVATLERAERIHRNNLIKARMVFNLEIVQAVGGLTTDLALALRPAVLRKVLPRAIGELDTWQPPSSMSTQLANRIRQAEEIWKSLLNRFHQLGNEIEMLKGTVAQAVDQLPGVRNAKQLWEFHMNRLGEMIADLRQAEALRGQIGQLTQDIEAARGVTNGTQAAWRAAQSEWSAAQGALLVAKNQLPQAYWDAANRLKKAQDHLTDVLRDVRAFGADDTIRTSAQAAVAEASAALAAVEARSAKQMKVIADLQNAVDAKAGPVKAAWDAHVAAGRTYDGLVGRRQILTKTLTMQYNDLKAADITAQGRIAAQAEREWRQAVSQGRQQVGQGLMEKEAERERVFNEANAARQLVNDLRAEAERATTWNRQVGSALGTAVRVVLKPITVPIGLLIEAWEWAFGVSQSPQEIVNFLVRGQAVVARLREYAATLETKILEQEQLVERVRAQVDACVKGATITAPTAPQPAGAAATTHGAR